MALATTGSWTLATAQSETLPRPYDPLDGLDPDGRIPRIQLPGDLPHPERWRYTPPGRIKPARPHPKQSAQQVDLRPTACPSSANSSPAWAK